MDYMKKEHGACSLPVFSISFLDLHALFYSTFAKEKGPFVQGIAIMLFLPLVVCPPSNGSTSIPSSEVGEGGKAPPFLPPLCSHRIEFLKTPLDHVILQRVSIKHADDGLLFVSFDSPKRSPFLIEISAWSGVVVLFYISLRQKYFPESVCPGTYSPPFSHHGCAVLKLDSEF
jgi:hypothetical protein